MNLVVDCSFIMSSVLPDEKSSFVEYHLYNLYAPALFYLECSNVLLTALNRKRISESNYYEYIDILRNLPIKIDTFSPRPESLHFISMIAIEHKLSLYDAAYVELAVRLKAKMASYDKAIINVCKLKNIETIE